MAKLPHCQKKRSDDLQIVPTNINVVAIVSKCRVAVRTQIQDNDLNKDHYLYHVIFLKLFFFNHGTENTEKNSGEMVQSSGDGEKY